VVGFQTSDQVVPRISMDILCGRVDDTFQCECQNLLGGMAGARHG
jgi:hypothetical protein